MESGVELMSLRKYSTIIIMPREARPGIILEEEKKRKPLSCFESEGAVRQRKRDVKSSREVGVLNSDRKFQQKKSWPPS